MTPCLMTITIWPPVMVFTTCQTCLEPAEGLSLDLHGILPKAACASAQAALPRAFSLRIRRMGFLGVHILTG